MKRQRVINRLAPAFAWLWVADHDFGGFDEGYGGVAGFEGEFADSVGGDDSGDALVADGEDDFGQQAVDDDLCDGAEELVAIAGGFDGTDAAGKDPVLESRVADADLVRGLAGRKQGGRGHGAIEVPPRQYFTRSHYRTGPGLGICGKTL